VGAPLRFVTPQLEVRDVAAAQRYYRDVLGFEVLWIWLDDYGAVSRGEIDLFLTRVDEPSPSVAAILVDDADAIYAEYRKSGAEIVDDIETKPWAMREFTIRDPDGNRFRIGHGDGTPASDLPEMTVFE
jgi:uncharacterized glyoxalase superfamily protein PhnB